MEISRHEPGMFSWADMATPDLDGSQKFYTSLLGLEHEDTPVGNGMVYSMLKKNGRGVCAMYNMAEEMKAMTGSRPAWRTYFTVENTDEMAERAMALGATVFAGPMDVFTAGRKAVLHDPTGAEFALWQPIDNVGAGVFAEPGALCWTELATNDTATATRFYSSLFGWSVQTAPSPVGGVYTLFMVDDRRAAGMLEIKPEWGSVPPHWSVWFDAGDLDAAMARAEDAGAQVKMRSVKIAGVGKFSLIEDPQGSHFSMMEFAPARDPIALRNREE